MRLWHVAFFKLIIAPYLDPFFISCSFLWKIYVFPLESPEVIFFLKILSSGILDQGSGVLVVFDETPVDKTYENTLELIHEMGKVVDALYSKAKKLQWWFVYQESVVRRFELKRKKIRRSHSWSPIT